MVLGDYESVRHSDKLARHKDSYRAHLLADENWMAQRVTSGFSGNGGGGCLFGGPVGGYGGCSAWNEKNEEVDDELQPKPSEMPSELYLRSYAATVLEFDEDGMGRKSVAALLGTSALTAQSVFEEAESVAQKVFAGNRGGVNDHEDAFRHAYANYVLTKQFGAATTKMIGESHERSRPNAWRERVMDLYNNHVGRVLALAGDSRPAEVVILHALTRGLLMTKMPNVAGGRDTSYYDKSFYRQSYR